MQATLATHLRKLARLSLAAAIVLIPFRYALTSWPRPVPPVYQGYTDFFLFASDIFLGATLLLWLASLVLAPRRLTVRPLLLSGPIAGLTVMALVSTLFSAEPLLSFYHSLRLMLLAGLYLYLLNEIKSLKSIAIPAAIQLFIQAAVGIAQVWQQRSLGLNFLDELALDPAWSGVSVVWSDGVRLLRAYGLTDHPNILGGCLAFALLLLAVWYIEVGPRWRALLGSLFAFGALALLLTFSRAAWLALSGGVLLSAALFIKTRQSQPLLDWLSLGLAGLILVAPFTWQYAGYVGVRFNQGNSFNEVATENRSLSERAVLNDMTNTIFAKNAWVGVGVGALPLVMRDLYPNFPFYYQPAHIVLLDVAAETGLPGALFYSLLLVAPWLALWWKRNALVFSPALIGMSGLLLAVTLIGFFDYYTWLLAPGRLWQWLIWGVWGLIYQSSFKERRHA